MEEGDEIIYHQIYADHSQDGRNNPAAFSKVVIGDKEQRHHDDRSEQGECSHACGESYKGSGYGISLGGAKAPSIYS